MNKEKLLSEPSADGEDDAFLGSSSVFIGEAEEGAVKQPLSVDNPRFEIQLGTMLAVYELNSNGGVEFSCYPVSKIGHVARNKGRSFEIGIPEALTSVVPPIPSESLVQIKIDSDHGPSGFSQGRTLRGAPSTKSLRLDAQSVLHTKEDTHIRTSTSTDFGLVCHHDVYWRKEASFLTLETTIENHSLVSHNIEMISSFCLGGITPFHSADAPNQLKAHRFRSAWSAEGRHEAVFLEDLHLERSWLGWSKRVERFGQVGSLPVRGFFPFLAIEDIAENVFWGVQLAHPGSWQMEIEREGDKVSISGGLADREFGHWWKTLVPGASLTTPRATIVTIEGTLDDLCHALTSAQATAVQTQPKVEQDLPIIFNEWCSSWGNPNESDILKVAKRLAKTRTRYIVIDDGWAFRNRRGIQQNGDWNIDKSKFPRGLKPVCDAIRDMGLIPGLWFEMEVCTEGSEAFAFADHHLWRDGKVLQVGTRRFWDFRDPFTIDYLTLKVINRLKDDGFGYLKIDYNETIPIGCDGCESLGEGLRIHLEGVQAFLRRIRAEMPELVIENCSSGGHRLEPSMMALSAMGSSSDAHEPIEIPIIAASLHRLILPQQNQIWAVLHEQDTLQRTRFSLSATFLGRMCISGDIAHLSAEQLSELCVAQDFYVYIVPILRDGKSYLHRSIGRSWRHPEGWQAIVRFSDDGKRLVIIIHSFARPFSEVKIPLSNCKWKLDANYNFPSHEIDDGHLIIRDLETFSGAAAAFVRE